MSAVKVIDHMGYEIDAVGPKTGLASLSTFGRPGRTPDAVPEYQKEAKGGKLKLDAQGRPTLIPKRYWNVVRHEWVDTPPPSYRVASTEDGTPLSFAEKAPPRDTADPPPPITAADIARAHGRETMKRIRGV